MFDIQPTERVPDPPFSVLDEDTGVRREPTRPPLPPEPEGDGWVPPGLAEMAPGVVLSALLSAVDAASASPDDRVILVSARQRLISHLQARSYEDIAAIEAHFRQEHEDPASARDQTAMEIASALRLTRRSAETEVDTARELTVRLPRVGEALRRGHIDYRRARVCALGTEHLPAPQAREVIDRVIDDAGAWTSGQLRSRLRRACLDTDADTAQTRYDHAVADRKLVSRMNPDGTIDLFALDLPADRAAAAMERINHLARSLPRTGDRRTADQRRADVLLDLLLGTRPGEAGSRRNRGVIDLRVDLRTLTGLADEPGELAGYGPVVADLARRLVDEHSDAEWRYTITGHDGKVLATGTTRRRPTAAERRHIQARDDTCIFPGCRRPARQADLDHRRRWADGGVTHPGNQAPLCRYHHDGKDRLGWSYRPLPDGRYRWTSPLGHRYTSGRHP